MRKRKQAIYDRDYKDYWQVWSEIWTQLRWGPSVHILVMDIKLRWVRLLRFPNQLRLKKTIRSSHCMLSTSHGTQERQHVVICIRSEEVLGNGRTGGSLSSDGPQGRGNMTQGWIELSLFPDTSPATLREEKDILKSHGKESITLAFVGKALLQLWLMLKAAKGWRRGRNFSEFTVNATRDDAFLV